MNYLVIHPANGDEIFCTDEISAKMAALELGATFYMPTSNFDDPENGIVFNLVNGAWIQNMLSEMKCTCGCHL